MQARRKVITRRHHQVQRGERDSVYPDLAAGAARLTHMQPVEQDEEMRPLEFWLIRRRVHLYEGASCETQLAAAGCSGAFDAIAGSGGAAQLCDQRPPCGRDVPGIIMGATGFLLLAAVTQWTMHYRSRLALELGEAVVHDLRRDVFAHLQTMTASFYHKTPAGRIISRMTSDIEVIRSLVQDVLFVSMVGLGQMIFAAAFMFWYDHVLFLMILVLAPVLWAMNLYFRRRLSKALRASQESMSQVTSTLAESVSGIRVTQSFVRQKFNARMFLDIIVEHSGHSMLAARRSGALPPCWSSTTRFL
jgi:ATP-binding cassette subfamily B protein